MNKTSSPVAIGAPPAAPLTACKICGGATSIHGQALVRRRHPAKFLRCGACGFIFIDQVVWLAEAYADPINVSDTGYVTRNLSCQARTQMFIEHFLDPAGRFLDYAAGYGLFVRLMRDLGYDFRWADRYCQNLFARGFEEPFPLRPPLEAVTAFEVFEHLVEPLQEITEIAAVTDCLIFSTCLTPQPIPTPEEWWYFGLPHGQHVAFYSRESLEFIAKKFGYTLLTDGESFHAFTRKPIPPQQFKRIDSQWWKRWIRRTRHRVSLSGSDRDRLEQGLPPANQ